MESEESNSFYPNNETSPIFYGHNMTKLYIDTDRLLYKFKKRNFIIFILRHFS